MSLNVYAEKNLQMRTDEVTDAQRTIDGCAGKLMSVSRRRESTKNRF